MRTDAALKNLNPKDKPDKVADRDGKYVRVRTNGTISFRYDYALITSSTIKEVTGSSYLPIAISQLRYAVLTADSQGFARVAKRLNMEQSTFERKVKDMEIRARSLRDRTKLS